MTSISSNSPAATPPARKWDAEIITARQHETWLTFEAGIHKNDTVRARVARVSESAAVIAIRKPARTFTTLSGKRVQFQPKPRTAYISPCSEVEILNR